MMQLYKKYFDFEILYSGVNITFLQDKFIIL